MTQPATPNVEVKLCLRPDRVLDGDHRLQPAVADFFGAGPAATWLRMAFLDGRELALHPAGWDVRLRKHEGEHALELTYKRRYAVPDGRLEPVLAQAAADGSTPTSWTTRRRWSGGSASRRSASRA